MDAIDITGLDKAAVLAALYNASQPLGMGFLNPLAREALTIEGAREILADCEKDGDYYFDYLQGRVMKIDLKDDNEVLVRMYDHDNGTGAAARAVEALRSS
jgi:hypothetical protein